MTDAQDFLRQSPCDRCRSGTLRPIDVVNDQLQIRCTNRTCDSSRSIALPRLNRKVIYLDTSTLSHMARAAGGKGVGPYARLREALAEAVYKNVVGCVASSLVRTEAELFRDAEPILAVCRELGTIRVNHQLHVEEAQIYRAFGRFLQSEPPARELRPPMKDAFERDVHAWHGNLSFHTRFAPQAGELADRRRRKEAIRADFERIYGRYALEGLSFADIALRETDGFCNFLCSDLTFYKLVSSKRYQRVARAEAERQVRTFLQSDHIRTLPFVVINGRLHAALAIAFRNSNARHPKSGDAYDIEHIRTYVPYVDVFITDGYMATIANQGNVAIAREYGTIIRSLGAADVDEFIDWLIEATTASETATITAQVYDAIADGGYLRDFLAFATQYVGQLKHEEEPPA